MTRKAYPSDVSDDKWASMAPYLTLMREDAPQGDHPLCEVFNGLRHIVHTGMQWRFMAHDLPPWYAVYQQTQRRMKKGRKRVGASSKSSVHGGPCARVDATTTRITAIGMMTPRVICMARLLLFVMAAPLLAIMPATAETTSPSSG